MSALLRFQANVVSTALEPTWVHFGVTHCSMSSEIFLLPKISLLKLSLPIKPEVKGSARWDGAQQSYTPLIRLAFLFLPRIDRPLQETSVAKMRRRETPNAFSCPAAASNPPCGPPRSSPVIPPAAAHKSAQFQPTCRRPGATRRGECHPAAGQAAKLLAHGRLHQEDASLA